MTDNIDISDYPPEWMQDDFIRFVYTEKGQRVLKGLKVVNTNGNLKKNYSEINAAIVYNIGKGEEYLCSRNERVEWSTYTDFRQNWYKYHTNPQTGKVWMPVKSPKHYDKKTGKWIPEIRYSPENFDEFLRDKVYQLIKDHSMHAFGKTILHLFNNIVLATENARRSVNGENKKGSCGGFYGKGWSIHTGGRVPKPPTVDESTHIHRPGKLPKPPEVIEILD